MGEKPLYFGWQGKVFLFGSELKALRAHPVFCASVDRDSLCLLLRYNYIPAPWSIYTGISKLLPGTWLTLESGQREPRIEAYWSVKQAVEAGKSKPFTGNDNEAVSALDSMLKAVIGRQMVADVPLGALLSGGIDSSIIVALMQAQSSRPINTFTIGFRELQQNEAEHARAVARHLGTEHTELYVDPERALGVITGLGMLYDEPFADSSQIPSFLISHLAGQHVKVALTGDGADELFCGYSRYLLGQNRLGRIASLPPFARHGIANALTAVAPRQWDTVYRSIGGMLPARMRVSVAGDKVHKLAEKLRMADTADDWYRNLMTEWPHPEDVVCGGTGPTALFDTYREGILRLNAAEDMMFIDAVTYLPDDILTKVDRAAMGVSLETRVPFLDHHVVEMAWRLPMDMKLRDGHGKWVLRQVLDKYVPRHLVDRPKQGFGVPLAEWLRGPLRDWAESLLGVDRLKQEGYFRPEPIRKKWEEHLSGDRNWHAQLWSVLMFQTWLEALPKTPLMSFEVRNPIAS
jgi:asparagine synthase (glutamine-hydrolysing)